ncbi:MAG: MBL fold metallo-hydrolase [Desulfitobacteriaceae bacterium]|nr:MBL fold metallo-hydrolase [Desulfitobacteriaceae bacterium]MDI6913051.1 MBL fold metallo-hydrolase [Desulfitobacteriaceae bacterium]
MPEQIMENIYIVEIPLPQNPLKALNSYVIIGEKRNLIIDTGMNREECLEAMSAGLGELEIDLAKTDFFITHMHADHLGLVSRLAAPGRTIYFNRPDAEIFLDESKWNEQMDFAQLCGFPTDELKEAIEKHPGYRYKARGDISFTYLEDGDTLSVGGYTFRVVSTPGHTPGHFCLYEPERKILVSGDHILGKITPNISSWSDGVDPLHDYLESLDKINTLEIKTVLPGHRHIFHDCQKRIQELKNHHAQRAEEILAILASGAYQAYDVAARMTWDMTYKNWAEFPVSQKWFATGEAISHLQYLENKGFLRKERIGDKLVYFLLNGRENNIESGATISRFKLENGIVSSGDSY